MTTIISVTFNSDIKPAISKKSLLQVANIVINSLDIKKSIEMGIVITNDEEIKGLNSAYRQINSATDVLSFHMQPDENDNLSPSFITPPDEIQHIGEVIISYETASRQAKENSITITEELTFLLVHGILHLMNYDHENDIDRKAMESKEKEMIKKIKSVGV